MGRRIASNGSRRAIRRSRIVVVSQSNRTHIVISITSVVVECVVVSLHRSRIATVIIVITAQSVGKDADGLCDIKCYNSDSPSRLARGTVQ